MAASEYAFSTARSIRHLRCDASGRRSGDPLPEHETVAIDGAHGELAHAPRFIPQRFDDRRPGRPRLGVHRLDIAHHQVGDVGVVAQARRWRGIPAFAGHDAARVADVEAPAGIAHRADLEPEGIAIEGGRHRQIGNRENKTHMVDHGAVDSRPAAPPIHAMASNLMQPADPAIAAMVRGIAAGRTALVVELLSRGGDPALTDTQGVPLLRWCAHHGDVTAVALLVERGADPALLGVNLDLHGAAFHGHLDLVAWCLERGASASHRDPVTGETPVHAALCKANRPVYDGIVALLLRHGADVHAATTVGAPLDSFMRDVRGLGETALHRAAAFASATTIDLLLQAGASREARDIAGQTPLAWASWHLRPDAILRRLCYGPHRIHPQRDGSYDHGSGWGHAEAMRWAPPTP